MDIRIVPTHNIYVPHTNSICVAIFMYADPIKGFGPVSLLPLLFITCIFLCELRLYGILYIILLYCREQVEELQQYLGNTPTPEQHVHMKNEVSEHHTNASCSQCCNVIL